jgi:uncharacterized membrane protein YhaH (DUF805 family)
MSFGQAVSSVLRQYVGFTGRARRSEFWWAYLFYLLAYAIPYGIGFGLFIASTDPATGEPSGPLAVVGGLILGLSILVGLGLILPLLAVSVRRLHDTGRSGFWYFISFVPLVGGIILLVFLAQDTQRGPNAYGPDPKAPAEPAHQGYGQGYGYPAAPYGSTPG